jgi:hypothetical protein
VIRLSVLFSLWNVIYLSLSFLVWSKFWDLNRSFLICILQASSWLWNVLFLLLTNYKMKSMWYRWRRCLNTLISGFGSRKSFDDRWEYCMAMLCGYWILHIEVCSYFLVIVTIGHIFLLFVYCGNNWITLCISGSVMRICNIKIVYKSVLFFTLMYFIPQSKACVRILITLRKVLLYAYIFKVVRTS